MAERKKGHNPVFCHWYPTKTCGQSNPTVRSSWDNVTSPVFWWPSTREARGRRPASRQSGARVHGTVSQDMDRKPLVARFGGIELRWQKHTHLNDHPVEVFN